MLALDTERTSDAGLDFFCSHLGVSLGKAVLSSDPCLFLFCLVLFCFVCLVWFYFVLFIVLVWFVFPLKECINSLGDP